MPQGLGTVIDEDQLKAFVNSAEWSLGAFCTSRGTDHAATAASNETVLHFLLFVPSPDCRPMLIRDAAGVLLDSNAFILPQWGGVVIANPHSPMRLLERSFAATYFSTFAMQLQTLLGVPRPAATISRWQLDSILRRRTLEAARDAVDTLAATDQLAREVTRLRIGDEVRADVQRALRSLDEVRSFL